MTAGSRTIASIGLFAALVLPSALSAQRPPRPPDGGPGFLFHPSRERGQVEMNVIAHHQRPLRVSQLVGPERAAHHPADHTIDDPADRRGPVEPGLPRP